MQSNEGGSNRSFIMPKTKTSEEHCMVNRCIVCSTEFESPNRRQYCSDKCYHKQNYIKQQYIKHVCKFCGKEFISKNKNRAYCSSACSAKYLRRMKAPNKTCKLCGKELPELSQSDYCSKKCRDTWQNENPRLTKTCPQCGIQFKTNEGIKVYCSKECQWDSMRRIIHCQCKNCGIEFIPKSNNRITFCTLECYFKWQKKHKREKIKKIRICKICGKEFISGNGGTSYCSDTCREIKRKQCYEKQKRIKAKKEAIIKVCVNCGEEFRTTNNCMKFCRQKCSNSYWNRKREVKRRKKIQLNGDADYSITLAKLYKRDKGICCLCDVKVNMNVDTNSDEYGSIDHIIPISKGGKHIWANVQLAHRSCNSMKRDNYS